MGICLCAAPAAATATSCEMPPSFDTPGRRLHFITVDAETEVIREGISTIAAIRDTLEAREQLRTPR